MMLDPFDYYILLRINSMRGLLHDGWEVDYSSQVFEKYQKYKSSDCIVVSIFGKLDVGKSLILSKISEKNCPLFKEALGVLYPIENKNIIYINSSIFNSPIINNEVYYLSKKKNYYNEKENEYNKEELISIIKDKEMTEQFILNFLVYCSNILIFVLNDLTYSQQVLYNKIKKLSIGKKVIVIHNLKNYQMKSQVSDYIIDYLSCSLSFKLKKYYMLGKNTSNKNISFYLDLSDESRNQSIFHFFMAQEHTEAGDYYNMSSINQIQEIINTCFEYQKFPIFEKICDFLFLYSKNLFQSPINRENISFENKSIRIIKEHLIFAEWINKDFLLKKKTIPYRYYKSTNGKYFYIEFIICGILKKLQYSIQLKNGFYIFHISGIKSLLVEKEELCVCKSDSGKFELDIEISIDEIYLKDSKIRNRKMEKGVVTLEFALQNINQEEYDIIF